MPLDRYGAMTSTILNNLSGPVAEFDNFLTFTADEPGVSLSMIKSASDPAVLERMTAELECRENGGAWRDYAWNGGEGMEILLADKGDRVEFRAKSENPVLSLDNSSCYEFRSVGSVLASGSVMSLLYADPRGHGFIPSPYCFSHLFFRMKGLLEAPELPALHLSEGCYYSMFDECENLRHVPDLPAVSLSPYSCQFMFNRCYAMTGDPVLRSELMPFRSCYSMFSWCRGITSIELRGVLMERDACGVMTKGCRSLSRIRTRFTSWKHGDYGFAGSWSHELPAEGVFECDEELCNDRGMFPNVDFPATWTVVRIRRGLEFRCLEDGFIGLDRHGDASLLTAEFEHDRNDDQWSDCLFGADGAGVMIPARRGEVIRFRTKSRIRSLNASLDSHFSFRMGGRFAAEGRLSEFARPLVFNQALPDYMFARLFRGCAGLVRAPELDFLNLSKGCFQGMFEGCTGLAEAPELPVGNWLAEDCYREMFAGCTGLRESPWLRAYSIPSGAYAGLFRGCSSLTRVKVSLDSWDALNGTLSWLDGVSPSGEFQCCSQLPKERGYSRIPTGWSVREFDATNYLSFEMAGVDGGSLSLDKKNAGNPNSDLEYDYGDGVWKAYSWDGSAGLSLPMAFGDRVRFRAKSRNGYLASNDYSEYKYFRFSNYVRASGSVMSLLDRTDRMRGLVESKNRSAFSCLFTGCGNLLEAPELPSETVCRNSYNQMFSGCDMLRRAPVVRGRVLEPYCMNGMFKYCYRLVDAPEIITGEIMWHSCSEMFFMCDSMLHAPESMPNVDYVCINAFNSMFKHCHLLRRAPKLPSWRLNRGAYCGMFGFCYLLEEGPEIPEIKEYLGESCFISMFWECSRLRRMRVNFKAWEAVKDMTNTWMHRVSAEGVFECPAELPEIHDESHVPAGWTVVRI